jgi:hypothetical protein
MRQEFVAQALFATRFAIDYRGLMRSRFQKLLRLNVAS